MKKLMALGLFLILIVSCSSNTKKAKTTMSEKMTDSITKAKWSLTQNIKTPESTYQDPVSKFIFISNINGGPTDKDGKGYISLLDARGNVINNDWVTGLNAPKGMRSYKHVLWVTDIDSVHAIDMNKGKRIGTIRIPGSVFLNDIAVDEGGAVFVSDMKTSKIHRIKSGKVKTFIEGENLANPNGLIVRDNKLYVAAWGKGMRDDWTTEVLGTIYSIDLASKEIAEITSPLGNLDGIEFDNNGNFLVSDWIAGKVFRVTPDGESEVIYTGKKGTADIGFLPKTNELLIPLMTSDKIISIQL